MGWMSRPDLRDHAEDTIHRLVLWNIDLTLVDVARVTRAAYAEAFVAVTGRRLVQLPQLVGLSEPEIFFDALGRNGVSLRADGDAEQLLIPFGAEFATRLAARRDQLTTDGSLLPGAGEALKQLKELDGVVQSVLTGSSRPNAALKLRVFGLDRYLDLAIGGFAGSEPYPKGALLRAVRLRAQEKYQVSLADKLTVYIADSARDVAGADLVLPDLTDLAPLTDLLTARPA
jgi:phosphoglycolate phosphatase-like HAD superfamily hydrolase